MKNIQKIASRVFIISSLLFGLVGIAMILINPDGQPVEWIGKILGSLGFVILSSFGISVGYKYLT